MRWSIALSSAFYRGRKHLWIVFSFKECNVEGRWNCRRLLVCCWSLDSTPLLMRYCNNYCIVFTNGALTFLLYKCTVCNRHKWLNERHTIVTDRMIKCWSPYCEGQPIGIIQYWQVRLIGHKLSFMLTSRPLDYDI